MKTFQTCKTAGPVLPPHRNGPRAAPAPWAGERVSALLWGVKRGEGFPTLSGQPTGPRGCVGLAKSAWIPSSAAWLSSLPGSTVDRSACP